MGARRRKINQQKVFGEAPEELDPYQSSSKGDAQKFVDTQARSGRLVPALLFLVVCGWAILLVVHRTLSA
jgi:hypothetical protein